MYKLYLDDVKKYIQDLKQSKLKNIKKKAF